MGIPITEVVCWLDVHGVHDQETRLEYCQILGILDALWLELVRDKLDTARKTSKPPASAPSSGRGRHAPSFG